MRGDRRHTLALQSYTVLHMGKICKYGQSLVGQKDKGRDWSPKTGLTLLACCDLEQVILLTLQELPSSFQFEQYSAVHQTWDGNDAQSYCARGLERGGYSQTAKLYSCSSCSRTRRV